MSRRCWSSRFVLWAAVCALVLKAAVPLFAASAAQVRGLPVAEICTVYGVAPAAAGADEQARQSQAHDAGHEDPSAPSGHQAEHCALTALAALAVPDVAPPGLAFVPRSPLETAPHRIVLLRDASAAWAARLQHGPPARA